VQKISSQKNINSGNWFVMALPMVMVGVGGSLGAMTRFLVRQLLPAISPTSFPLSTLLVNILGCFFAGFVYFWLEQSGTEWSQSKVLFFFVGFLGAFTTFSAFALDSLHLFNQGENLKLMLNITANCVLCLLAVFVGALLGGRIAAN
jgi:fluoride exporter